MTDYLLVHGAGQGAWSWGGVWGYLTAPEEHPPRLYTQRRAAQVHCLDLPGHGSQANGDAGKATFEECVEAIISAVKRDALRDVVLVGHGFAGALVLQAATKLPQPPKRVILVAGIIPGEKQEMLAVLPQPGKMAFSLLSKMSKLSGQRFKLPRSVIANNLCNGIDPMEVVHIVGRFGPMPTRVLRTPVSLEEFKGRCPVTYVVLNQDKVVPAPLQRQMASRIPRVEITEIDSCHQVMLYRPKELADILLQYA